MKNSPLVSIIVPIYNVEKYLHKCLETIMNQDYENIEVILINDGSKDSSEDICKYFCNMDSRFSYVYKENGGLSSARNKGIEYASGDYVCFVDSDDYLSSSYVSNMVKNIGECDLIICNYNIVYKKKSFTPFEIDQEEKELKADKDKEDLIKSLYMCNTGYKVRFKSTIMPVWKNMYSMSFLRNNKLVFVSEKEVYMEDLIFNLKAYAMANSIKICRCADYFYVIHKGSLSQKYRDNMFGMLTNNYYKCIDIIENSSMNYLVPFMSIKKEYIIAYSVFKECQCGYKLAKSNMIHIFNSLFFNELNNKSIFKMPHRFRIILALFKRKLFLLTWIFVQLLLKFEFIYRKLRWFAKK